MSPIQAAEVQEALHTIVEHLYADDHVIPILEGGLVFRAISDKTGVKEEEVSREARRLGYWPHTPNQIEDACQERNFPTTGIAAFLRDPFADMA